MAPREFLRAIMKENVGMRAEEMVSAFFTLAADLCLAYPAQAAGQIDWEAVANDRLRGIPVPDSLPLVIRVILHRNTNAPQSAIKHCTCVKQRNFGPTHASPGKQS